MSWWTFVNGVVTVHVPGRTQAEIEYILNTILDHLPRVTGSERNMEIHINKVNGCDSSCNCDEFHNYSNLGNGKHGGFETQSTYLLTIYGRLRDRMFETTLKEVSKWVHRLGTRLQIDDCYIKVKGYEQSYVFTNENNRLKNLYDWENETTWCDYLRWDYPRNENGCLLCGKPDYFQPKVYALTIECKDGNNGKSKYFEYEKIVDFINDMKNPNAKNVPKINDNNVRVVFFNSEEMVMNFTEISFLVKYCEKTFKNK